MTEWHDMDSAPKDRPILGWCEEPEYCPDCNANKSGNLCLFHAHAEGMSSAGSGPVVIEWGGAWEDSWEDGGGWLPDWWFRRGSEFEEAARPVLWAEITEPETAS